MSILLYIYLTGCLFNILHIIYKLRNFESRFKLCIQARKTISTINKVNIGTSFRDVIKFAIVVGVLLSWTWMLIKLVKR